MDCFVLVPKGYVALGKLSQAMIYGAKVVQVIGNFDEALKLADRILVIGNKPGRLLLDITVPVSRPRDFNSPALFSVRNKILDKLADPDFFIGADI